MTTLTSAGHLTGVRTLGTYVVARCPEHGRVGIRQLPTRHGWNAIRTEARAHDDIAHGIYRTDWQWEEAVRG